ncbi:hypothetical protein E2C01_041789 [Portunus trituberculatus]|uniref:Uncharacterized protein n=1 Tax=Portunus trituberculatus TaxID=210409 RepID=A0A5B7FUN8_PORTR|nr:hypothetical protein [Portunus trituberculatus]
MRCNATLDSNAEQSPPQHNTKSCSHLQHWTGECCWRAGRGGNSVGLRSSSCRSPWESKDAGSLHEVMRTLVFCHGVRWRGRESVWERWCQEQWLSNLREEEGLYGKGGAKNSGSQT